MREGCGTERTAVLQRHDSLMTATSSAPAAAMFTARAAAGSETDASMPPVPPGTPADAPDAIYAQASSENFPVASWLLPHAVRADLMAVYGFARLTDDIGDEAPGDRLATLDWLEAELERAGRGAATHPVLRRLSTTIAARDLSLQPFRDLIDANRQDQRVRRYETFDDLVGYCRLSANPVGRLVLAVFGRSTPDRVALSDDVCTGLQVVEHLQDVGEDIRQNRIYLPLEDLRAEGCDEDELNARTASPALRRVIATEGARARRLLRSGGPLAASLPWRERVAVAAFAGGGLAALDAMERAHFDVLATRCRPQPARLVSHLALLLAAPTVSSHASLPDRGAG
jgi:squalene synthase HpnC